MIKIILRYHHNRGASSKWWAETNSHNSQFQDKNAWHQVTVHLPLLASYLELSSVESTYNHFTPEIQRCINKLRSQIHS